MSVLLITGADRKFFLMVGALMHSLRCHAPNLQLRILDFGMSESQCRFFQAKGVLLPTPPDLQGTHFFVRKAAMGDYVAGLDWDTLVWLDSDMIVTGPLEAALAGLLGQMAASGAELAVCQDGAGTLGAAAATPGFGPFGAILRDDGADLSRPYYNTGMLVCRSRRFLAEWRDFTLNIPFHAIFEQNAFNILVDRKEQPFVLPAERWNRHGDLLQTSPNPADGPDVSQDGLILHATSPGERHHRHRHDMCLAIGGGMMVKGDFKLFREPALRRLQWQAIKGFLDEEAAALIEAGVAERGEGEAIPLTPPRPTGGPVVPQALVEGDQADVEAASPSLLRGADMAEALCMLAVSQSGRDDEAALTLFQDAAALQPRRPEIAYELGRALKAVGRPAAAQAEWRRTVELAPAHLDGWRALAFCYYETGAAEAAEAFARVLELCPGDATALGCMADFLLGQGRAAEAVPFLTRLLEVAPDQPSSWRLSASALVRLERWADAEDRLRTALRLAPHDNEAHRALVPLLKRRGDWRQALAEWEWRATPWGPPNCVANLPAWTGTEPPGTRVLLWPDQEPARLNAAFLPLCRYVDAVGHRPLLVPPGRPVPVADVQFRLYSLAHGFADYLTAEEREAVIQVIG